MSNNKKSFLKGALILAAANFLVKIIGAVFKIPLYGYIGKDGSGLFNVAYQIYTFMFIIATAGFPIAVSKMVAESIAKGNDSEARQVFKTARSLLFVIGLIGTLILYFFADNLAAALGNSDAALCIKAISPAVFLVAVVSSYRGYFQGKQNMYPTAFSEVIEASVKLGAGIFFALFFVGMKVDPSVNFVSFSEYAAESKSAKTILAASGAIFGVTAGTFFSLLLMTAIDIFSKKKPKAKTDMEKKSKNSILKELIMIAIPITIGASVSSLTSLIDLATIMNRLVINPSVFDKYAFLFEKGTEFFEEVAKSGISAAEIAEKKANILYGMYTGQAMPMFNLPLTIVVAVGMSVVPAISSSVAGSKLGDAKKMTESVIRLTMLFAVPCAIGMSVLSKDILGLLYSDSDASSLLSKLSIAVIFVSAVSVTNSVLQAYGKVYYPVINMVIGGLIKVIMNYNLIPVWGIDAVPVATNVCYAVIAVLNILCIIKFVKIRFSLLDFFLKPLAASLVMGAVAVVIIGYLNSALGSGKISTLITIFIAVLAYIIMIFLFRAVKREDIKNMPMGEKIEKILDKVGLLK